MAIKQTKAISRLYLDTLESGLESQTEDDPIDILEKCRKVGKYVFRPENNSYWGFVKIPLISSIRMIFAFQKGDSSSTALTDKVTDLLKDIEQELIFVDVVDLLKIEDYTYLIVTKKHLN